MDAGIINAFFFVLLTALLGGLLAKLLKLQPLVGYIISGVILAAVVNNPIEQIERLAQIGAILLLFSVGLELSIKRLGRMWKVAILGGLLQILFTTLIFFAVLAFGVNQLAALIIAFGFSLSSTAVVVKTLADKGEMDTIHGELMVGWLLVQDLSVIPIMVVLPVISTGVSSWIAPAMVALFKAGVIISFVLVFGRLIVPFIFHRISLLNSRELMVISALVLALGTALLTSAFGVSPALGAFLAGVVISDSQENHAVFSETRPLRDLFVAMFFVTLGMTIKPAVFIQETYLIFILAISVVLVKFVVFLLVNFIFKYHGKTAIQSSLGLAQVGEFAFIIITSSVALNLLPVELASIAIASALITLILTPFLFKSSVPIWRWLKGKNSSGMLTAPFFSGNERNETKLKPYQNHIILCGYGRVGKWVGKALLSAGVEFVVVDYSQKAIKEAKLTGLPAIYGDPSDPEVLEEAGAKSARLVVAAIPDRITQEELITYLQTINPNIKIISRAHFDDEWTRLKFLRVDKIIQPEFEAAVAIVRTLLVSMGKSKNEVNAQIKSLRQSRSLAKS
jgi:CPA2 family monovalent cation:H+ antiporter-2